ncbi:fasciclin [Actinoplanes sp. SE50]|uniref:fasciclin domain-containing protein n=1 Tax=unclassified Actinoplanes TaxID=2626549 RepID=UPI00023ECB2B|nr:MULTISPECIES: fasciclin domain-containing protein [unclassified Actinoplanes]AEV84788.1 beta-Ig-H3/fasciclin [Actinoplanes sp. SE50/110]ATO83180.1 fasciclin [Actinoplanes sp. SE50]SLM00587.1 extracellular protein containing fasciclin domain [Actinoplanes sp. SE50/110]
MRLTRLGKKAAAVATTAVVASTLTAAPAFAHGTAQPLKTRSLAAVLTADKSGFDRNGRDYDILTAAVQAVLKAKPASPVGVLADGNTALTAFLPDDHAFELLVADIQHSKRLPSEKAAFTAVAGLGIDTVESVLLYHVVPGATIDRKAALKADGAKLKTAAGATVTVDVYGFCVKRIALIDADTSDRNPRVNRFDINKGNKQIAHGIDRVLRPIDLP